MPCCGQRRTMFVSPPQAVARPSAPPPSAAPAAAPKPAVVPAAASVHPPTLLAGASVKLRYLERSRILVRGPATGRQYEFSAADAVRPVAAADAEILLRTRFFRRA